MNTDLAVLLDPTKNGKKEVFQVVTRIRVPGDKEDVDFFQGFGDEVGMSREGNSAPVLSP